VEINGDSGFVETWVIGYHMEAPGSPIDSLVLALRYKDEVVRIDDDWKIIRRWRSNGTPGRSRVHSSASLPIRADCGTQTLRAALHRSDAKSARRDPMVALSLTVSIHYSWRAWPTFRRTGWR
jgi:hypothetical protein